MKCNNKHCKYYISADTNSKGFIRIIGVDLGSNSGGCKFSYCKLNRKNARRR